MNEDFLAATPPSASSPAETEANRRRAVHRLAERLARELHTRLMVAAATEVPDGTTTR